MWYDGVMIGLHVRHKDGQKRAIRGSHNGLFAPHVCLPKRPRIVVCEGFSDTLCFASDHQGDVVIGRPGCTFNPEGTANVVRARAVPYRTLITVLADGDAAGRRGAAKLAACILDQYPGPVETLAPPPGVKDYRECRSLENWKPFL